MLAIIKAFFSGVFSGMAQDQSKPRDSSGTLSRAKMALALADQPFTRFAAHAQMAKALYLGCEFEEMKTHKARALMIFSIDPLIGNDEEMRKLRAELDDLPQ